MKTLMFSATLFVAASAAQAQFAPPLTFDSEPAAATFAAAGAVQSLTFGDLSIDGGVVLGIPPFTSFQLPGTLHTTYATSHLGDDSLQSALTLTISGTWRYQRITGMLFNGLPGASDYVVDAYRAGQLVASDALRVIGGETDLFEVNFVQGIDQLVFRTAQADPSLWDFGIHYSVFSAPVPVPEPSTWALALVGAACIGAAYRRSRRSPD
ncbi:PEP-CTERM sorting domain-containing protein [Ideonella sp. BN130291]|uniref:PEP-CTERM sorting domain-containing protein n=1 Tax=Ideonella sp. BN130291 TaxID=3112940 RepID=UPI002E267EA9|nr:PEP-CTERM sorting domain-containing protein [Ideonella sp. BN130291]